MAEPRDPSLLFDDLWVGDQRMTPAAAARLQHAMQHESLSLLALAEASLTRRTGDESPFRQRNFRDSCCTLLLRNLDVEPVTLAAAMLIAAAAVICKSGDPAECGRGSVAMQRIAEIGSAFEQPGMAAAVQAESLEECLQVCAVINCLQNFEGMPAGTPRPLDALAPAAGFMLGCMGRAATSATVCMLTESGRTTCELVTAALRRGGANAEQLAQPSTAQHLGAMITRLTYAAATCPALAHWQIIRAALTALSQLPHQALSRPQQDWPSAVLEAHALAAGRAMLVEPHDEWMAASQVVEDTHGLAAALSAASDSALDGFYTALLLASTAALEAIAAAPQAVRAVMCIGILARPVHIAIWDAPAQALRHIPAGVQEPWVLAVARLANVSCSFWSGLTPAAASKMLSSPRCGTPAEVANYALDAANMLSALIQRAPDAAAAAAALEQPPARALWQALCCHATSECDDNVLEALRPFPSIFSSFEAAADASLKAATAVLKTPQAAPQPSQSVLQLAAEIVEAQLEVAYGGAVAAPTGKKGMDTARLTAAAQLLSALDKAGAGRQAAAAAHVGTYISSMLVGLHYCMRSDITSFVRLCCMLADHLRRNALARAAMLQGRHSHGGGSIWSRTAAEIRADQLHYVTWDLADHGETRDLVDQGLRVIEDELQGDSFSDAEAKAEADVAATAAAAAAAAAMQALLEEEAASSSAGKSAAAGPSKAARKRARRKAQAAAGRQQPDARGASATAAPPAAGPADDGAAGRSSSVPAAQDGLEGSRRDATGGGAVSATPAAQPPAAAPASADDAALLAGARVQLDSLQLPGVAVEQDWLVCPITKEVMVDPVVLVGDGRSYERAAIERYLAAGNKVSPSTGEPHDSLELVQNCALRRLLGA